MSEAPNLNLDPDTLGCGCGCGFVIAAGMLVHLINGVPYTQGCVSRPVQVLQNDAAGLQVALPHPGIPSVRATWKPETSMAS